MKPFAGPVVCRNIKHGLGHWTTIKVGRINAVFCLAIYEAHSISPVWDGMTSSTIKRATS